MDGFIIDQLIGVGLLVLGYALSIAERLVRQSETKVDDKALEIAKKMAAVIVNAQQADPKKPMPRDLLEPITNDDRG